MFLVPYNPTCSSDLVQDKKDKTEGKPCMESKLIKIYVDKKTDSIFIRTTKPNEKMKGFVLRNHSYGKALPENVSDLELGKAVRAVLQNCL